MRKRGNVYYAHFRANGRVIQKRLSSDFDAAKVMLNELRSRADKAQLEITDNNYPWKELKALFLKWARQQKRRSTAQQYEGDLRVFEQFYQPSSVRQITASLIIEFRNHRLSRDGVCPRTVNRNVGTISNMLNKAADPEDFNLIANNPIRGVTPLAHDELRKVRRVVRPEEVVAFFRESPKWLIPAWRMLFTSGIRRGELIGMKFADIDFDQKVVTVRSGTAKNHKPREIPLDDKMVAMLAEIRDAAPYRKPNRKTKPGRLSKEHVFVTGANTPWNNPGNLLRAFYAVCRRAGIEGGHKNGTVDIHAIRHSFITLSLENGANLKDVQEIVGHHSEAFTLKVYAKASEAGKRAVVNALPFANATEPDHVVPFEKPQDVCNTCASNSESSQVVDTKGA